MATHGNPPVVGVPTDPDPAALRAPHGRRLSRRAWLLVGAIALVFDLVLVTAIAVPRLGSTAGNQAQGPTATTNGRSPLDAVGTTLAQIPCIASHLSWTSHLHAACGSWSATVSPADVISAVSIYGAGQNGYLEYAGVLPLSLHWGEALTDVAASLGQPRVIYHAFGAPRLVYSIAGQAYRALELQFDDHDNLIEIAATLAS